jgi:MOSC domain-containing protein YiiM
MHDSPQHRTMLELEQGMADVLRSPLSCGRLVTIFVRPRTNERKQLETATLSPEGGIDGDRWSHDSYYREKGGGSDPRCQVSLMNARYLEHIAGEKEAMCLAGDNLILDLDLSDENLPTGSRLAIGNEVVIEISDLKHTGCSKFKQRYGQDALTFTNNERGRQLHLRGRYAKIIAGGTICVGDGVSKLTATAAKSAG